MFLSLFGRAIYYKVSTLDLGYLWAGIGCFGSLVGKALAWSTEDQV